MTWILRGKEIDAVLRLDGAKRYWYCVKKVADEQQLWSLKRHEKWALLGDDVGRELVPVWPHQEFARLCAEGVWEGYQASEIELNAWLERWTPGMTRDGHQVAVFPLPGDRGVIVGPQRLEADLRLEITQYD